MLPKFVLASIVVCVMVFEVSSNRRNSSWPWPQKVCTLKTKKLVVNLITIELLRIRQIKHYTDYIRTFLPELQRKYDEFSKVTKVINSKQEYLANVMNTFSLLKRSSTDWKLVTHLVQSLPGKFNPIRKNEIVNEMYNSFAVDKTDLQKLANLTSGFRGLSRLQSIYHISADTLANGQLEGTHGHAILSAQDCFDMATYCFKEYEFFKCIEWLEETMKKMNNKSDDIVSRRDVLELYFAAKFNTGDITGSTLLFNQLLAEYPNFKLTSGLLGSERYMESEERNIIRFYNNAPLRICEHQTVNAAIDKYLKCRYVHYNKPYLRIGPFKMEELHLDPPLLLFPQILTEEETEKMIEFGRPRMEISKVYAASGKNELDEENRNSYWTWVEDADLPAAARLSVKSALIGNMNLREAETNQMNSYGLAGEFRPHFDTDNSPPENGLAYFSTVLFYLNDVPKGGYTIFPKLNVSLAPTRGSAIFFFNRKPDGERDPMLLHGGCPVLQGNKWVVVSLFTSRQQDFPKCTKERKLSFKYFYL